MLWVFGYGSLIFRPSFPFARAEPAFIRDWSRRFWQGSTDHRGVPGAPGRVVTLIHQPGATCVGRAYAIDDSDREEVLAGLDVREQGGYERHHVVAYGLDGSILSKDTLIYLANRENPNWLGPAEPEAIARQVMSSRGPSGDNHEYVRRLAAALREMGAGHDEEVFGIERLLDSPAD